MNDYYGGVLGGIALVVLPGCLVVAVLAIIGLLVALIVRY